MVEIDYENLWNYVIQSTDKRPLNSIHAYDHWLRVERNGCVLATQDAVNVTVVRLFALFHDSKRVNENYDPEHGKRGAEFAEELNGDLFNISEEEMSLLYEACCDHTSGYHHKDPTIGVCWDSDRLDIGRAGMIPNSDFMSSKLAKEIADHGSIEPWLQLAEHVIPDPTHHHYKYDY